MSCRHHTTIIGEGVATTTVKHIRLLIPILIAGSGIVTNSAPVRTRTVEQQENGPFVHNTSEGKWSAAPRIGLTFLEMLGERDDDNYIFYEPKAVTADREGNIYVLDSKNHRVQVFDHDHDYLFSFGRQGQGPGEFQRVECIDLDAAGNIYVGDPGNARIEVFDPSGTYLRSIRVRSTNIVFRMMQNGNILLRNPDLDGGRGLKEDHVPLFRVLDNDGNHIREFGQGRFFTRHPYTTGGNRSLMAMGKNDNACMAFLFQNRISMYSPDGDHLFTADRPLPQEKMINRELEMYTTINSGLDIDAKGRIWVVTYTRKWERGEIITRSYFDGEEQISGDRSQTETDLFEIQIFDADGVLLQKIPLTHYCDYLKIIDNRVYILDSDRLMQFYVYEIDEVNEPSLDSSGSAHSDPWYYH
ncbi:6-bladed beta-propeller [Gemmatimonadota bacterium]